MGGLLFSSSHELFPPRPCVFLLSRTELLKKTPTFPVRVQLLRPPLPWRLDWSVSALRDFPVSCLPLAVPPPMPVAGWLLVNACSRFSHSRVPVMACLPFSLLILKPLSGLAQGFFGKKTAFPFPEPCLSYLRRPCVAGRHNLGFFKSDPTS